MSGRKRGTDLPGADFIDVEDIVDLELGDIETPDEQPAEVASGSDVHSIAAPIPPTRPDPAVDELLIAYLNDREPEERN